MMKIDDLYNEVERDLKIDDTELDLESIRTPQLHNKYLKYYTQQSLQYKKLKDDYKILYRVKWEYYTGKAPAEVYAEKPFDLKILKADIGIYLEADGELQQLSQRMAYTKQIVDYLERILREINNRNWNIRNTIEWKKFLHGE
ncbi:MAG: recombination mediator protein UvsY [Candidatus Pacebacteria bacterium]|nr:recombination mediator protein UvsY [Candidatus Paceibacterota bacterium]|tara:strand:- start:2121 stop:2549 length:429 start_codon:yes stop_codon:yes gene_type:complete